MLIQKHSISSKYFSNMSFKFSFDLTGKNMSNFRGTKYQALESLIRSSYPVRKLTARERLIGLLFLLLLIGMNVAVCGLISSLSGCEQLPTDTNKLDCDNPVDYSGSADWFLSSDSIFLRMDHNFVGTLQGKIDSAGNVIAVMEGKLTAPLMQNSFVWEGKIFLSGRLELVGESYSLILSSTNDSLDLFWSALD